MYMTALNTVSDQGWGAKGGRGVETLTASLKDVRIFLMPSDMAGIYNSGGELDTGPHCSQVTASRNSGKKNSRGISKHH